MRFKDLTPGETFTFQPARVRAARILRCRKISPRGYAVTLPNGGLTVEHITTINVVVYQDGLTGVSYEA